MKDKNLKSFNKSPSNLNKTLRTYNAKTIKQIRMYGCAWFIFRTFIYAIRVHIKDRFSMSAFYMHIRYTSFRYWDEVEHVRSANFETGIYSNS